MSVHFHALKVAEIVPETAEANSIRFEIPPELRDEFAFKAGHHSEHLGHLLAVMQFLPRTYPDATW